MWLTERNIAEKKKSQLDLAAAPISDGFPFFNARSYGWAKMFVYNSI
jgi:hypothetical protein